MTKFRNPAYDGPMGIFEDYEGYESLAKLSPEPKSELSVCERMAEAINNKLIDVTMRNNLLAPGIVMTVTVQQSTGVENIFYVRVSFFGADADGFDQLKRLGMVCWDLLTEDGHATEEAIREHRELQEQLQYIAQPGVELPGEVKSSLNSVNARRADDGGRELFVNFMLVFGS